MAITTRHLTGFEHGLVAAAATAGASTGTGLFNILTLPANWSASTTTPRNGAYCAHLVAPASTVTNLGFNFSSGAKFLARFGVKVSSRPSSGKVMLAAAVANIAERFRIGISSTGVLECGFGTTVVTGPTIDTTNWHLIEVQQEAATLTVDWKVDGVLQTRAAQSNTDPIEEFYFGVYTGGGAQAFTADYDDFICGSWATAATDWYGDGKIIRQGPGSDGTHATVTSLSNGDATAAFTGTITTAFTALTDSPGTGGWSATRSTTDNIALRTATVGAYVEIKPATTALTPSANAVRALLSYSSPTTTANLAACDIRNSANAVTALRGLTGGVGAGYNVTANNFGGAIVTTPAAGWTAAEVNALRFRFGGCTAADISPVPTAQAMMLEVDWPVAVAATIPVAAASASATATLGLRAPTKVPLAASPAVATATASLFAPTSVPLDVSTAVATSALRLDAPTAYDTVLDADSPVSHWKLGESTQATDRKGVRHLEAWFRDGSSTTTVPTTTGLVTNNAAGLANRFDLSAGPSRYFIAASTTGSGVPYETATWSVEMWVSVADFSAGTYLAFFSRWTNEMFLAKVASAWQWGVNSSDLADAYHEAVVEFAPSLGQTHHLVGTFDGTNLILYMDGAEVARTPMTSTDSNVNAAPIIGDTYQNFDGTLDEVAWYGTALSPARVLAHYQAGAPVAPAPVVIPLSASASTASATLALRAPAVVTLGPSSAVASGAMGLFYAGMILATPGVVSYWRLGEASGSALDSKDSNPGTVFGGVTRQVAGLITNDSDAAMQSGGVTGTYVSMPSNANMNVGARLSVECWVKPAGIHATASPYAVGRLGNSFDWYIRHYNAGDARWEFTVYDTAAVSTTVTSSAEVAQVGVRQHLVMTYDATGTMQGYINGVSVGTPTRTPNANVRNNAEAFRVFSRDSTDVNTFNGTIDEVAFYNTVLTAQQVLDHYNAGAPPIPVTVPLGPGSGVGTGTLALRAPARVLLDASLATATATVDLRAPTSVPLAASSAVATATADLRAPTSVPLTVSTAIATGALALTAPTAATPVVVPLAAGSAQASAALALTAPAIVALTATSAATGTLSLTAPAIIALAASSATATATVALRAPPSLALAATGTAAATLGLRAPTTIALAAAASTATATLSLTTGTAAPAIIPLAAATSTATGTLALLAPAFVVLAAAPATATAALALRAPTTAPLQASTASASATLALTTGTAAPAVLPLDPAAASATATLAVRAPTALALDPAPATASGTLNLFVPGVATIGIVGAATATATLALRAPATVPLAASAAQASALVALTAPALLTLSVSAQATATLSLRAAVSLSLSASAQGTATLALLTRANLILSASGQASGTLALVVPTVSPATLLLAPGQASSSGQLSLRLVPRLALVASAQASGSLVVISTSLLEKHKRLYLEVPEQNLSPTTMITEGYLHLMVREPDTENQIVASIDERFYTVVVDETVMKVQIAEGQYLVAKIDTPENDTVEVIE